MPNGETTRSSGFVSSPAFGSGSCAVTKRANHPELHASHRHLHRRRKVPRGVEPVDRPVRQSVLDVESYDPRVPALDRSGAVASVEPSAAEGAPTSCSGTTRT